MPIRLLRPCERSHRGFRIGAAVERDGEAELLRERIDAGEVRGIRRNDHERRIAGALRPFASSKTLRRVASSAGRFSTR